MLLLGPSLFLAVSRRVNYHAYSESPLLIPKVGPHAGTSAYERALELDADHASGNFKCRIKLKSTFLGQKSR
jgi:hypothetical protein